MPVAGYAAQRLRAPDLAVEIVSATDAGRVEWERKLEGYQEAGIQELVRFDPASPEGMRLRAWDRVDGDLIERSAEGDRTPCAALGLHWVVTDDAELVAMLRLARDEAGLELLATLEEAREREAAAREREARLREQEARLRAAAESRVAELEQELRKLRGEG